MVDVAMQPNRVAASRPTRKRASLRTPLKRKSTAAFLMTLPLLLVRLLGRESVRGVMVLAQGAKSVSFPVAAGRAHAHPHSQ